MNIPGLAVGKNIRLLTARLRKKTRENNVGKVVEMLPSYFIVDFGNYKESFKYIDVLIPYEEVIQTKVDGKWTEHKAWSPIQPAREDAIEKNVKNRRGSFR